ncbi:hypothetical protein [Pseudidiomarina woesei]|uniref:Uncharacterized protein n=1 Tax=Pseudidiomarina woesei TaxID=1381080 RepID=A0A0K6HC33_9GAMM|nr:hypothetical protein [Pseudidiomarina woesei]CUA88321.1 hypothetical protein Ga0061064_2139 [Pseudidiomarina woesei]
MNKSDTSLFNTSQQRALAALGLPLWQKRTNDASQTAAESCYRLGPWLIIVPQPLAVSKPQWLSDLALALDTPLASLAEISPRQKADWPSQQQLHVQIDSTGMLEAQCKRDLWQGIMAQGE